MTNVHKISIPDAVERLFDIKISKHEAFRNSLNTLVNTSLFKPQKTQVSYAVEGRKKTYLGKSELVKFRNAILLQAIFPAPKTIRKFFTDLEERQALCAWAEKLLIHQQCISGIGLASDKLQGYFDVLRGSDDLTKVDLPNPFETLPQIHLSGNTSLCKLLLAQSASLSSTDSMIAYFLSDDLEKAARYARDVETDVPIIGQFRDLILKKYAEAIAFSDLLDEWRD
ncbi:hypothetical protein [Thalassospira lucentensis]|uniref:Uncharacterized protein n=1 Tax=Thalassospira lucentensis TaxID=168935 RepID=A0A358HTG4_9PROT|nr:hypothetical protein [Thalassospira lucentensis]HBU98476.1 hypothetical protein [Thalassospira lucentensis]HCW66368.1 hypothetical protein [Thalassospira lucentensis]